eukprot:316_1
MARLLMEAVQCYGKSAKGKQVYRGLNKEFIFTKFVTCFHVPLSTSTKFEKALNFATNGIVLELKQFDEVWCFNCSFVSSFDREREILFFGGSSALEIKNIWQFYRGKHQNYRRYVRAIAKIIRIGNVGPENVDNITLKVRDAMRDILTYVLVEQLPVDTSLSPYCMRLAWYHLQSVTNPIQYKWLDFIVKYGGLNEIFLKDNQIKNKNMLNVSFLSILCNLFSKCNEITIIMPDFESWSVEVVGRYFTFLFQPLHKGKQFEDDLKTKIINDEVDGKEMLQWEEDDIESTLFEDVDYDETDIAEFTQIIYSGIQQASTQHIYRSICDDFKDIRNDQIRLHFEWPGAIEHNEKQTVEDYGNQNGSLYVEFTAENIVTLTKIQRNVKLMDEISKPIFDSIKDVLDSGHLRYAKNEKPDWLDIEYRLWKTDDVCEYIMSSNQLNINYDKLKQSLLKCGINGYNITQQTKESIKNHWGIQDISERNLIYKKIQKLKRIKIKFESWSVDDVAQYFAFMFQSSHKGKQFEADVKKIITDGKINGRKVLEMKVDGVKRLFIQDIYNEIDIAQYVQTICQGIGMKPAEFMNNLDEMNRTNIESEFENEEKKVNIVAFKKHKKKRKSHQIGRKTHPIREDNIWKLETWLEMLRNGMSEETVKNEMRKRGRNDVFIKKVLDAWNLER